VKSDLDTLMQQRGFDALVVMGPASENYPLRYITNGVKVTEAIAIIRRGEPPVLLCGPMEREEAAKSGLPTVTFADFDLYKLVKDTGSYFEARLRMMAAVFARYGVSGTVSFYGLGDPGQSYMTLKRLSEMLPELTITGETETTIFDEAYMTKDASEIAAIRSVAERTNQVMAEAVAFLRGYSVRDNHLVRPDSKPLTIGDVRRYVRSRLLEYELETEGDMIFAIGHDAGVPHSRGEASDPLKLGQSIIFDLSPRELGGGYFHDMTRTWCLGYASPEVQRAYEQVMEAFNLTMSTLAVGEKCSTYQEAVCDLFERYGHKTIRSDPSTETGYVHSLGHGLGLQIHARPRFSSVSTDVIQPGQVFTVEPGLYYPDQGYGVRIEDTVYVDEKGTIHSLTPFPKDLVIPAG
jgi:Xaa-Pro aminopeptidase